jgi:hypothetical protein
MTAVLDIDARVSVDEWADPWWRLCNLYWMIDDEGSRFKFYPNDAQERLYRNLWYLNLILKARQQGFSTFIDLMALDFCLFADNKTAGIAADSKENASKLFRNKILYPYNNLPLGLRQARETVVESQSMLEFSNGSSLSVGVSLRSGTLQFLHVSEYGKIAAKFPDKAKEIKSGSFNAVKTGGYIFVESTAEGQGGEFYDMTLAAQKNDAAIKTGALKELTPLDMRFHFYAWWESPKYRLHPEGVVIDEEHKRYFTMLEVKHGIKLDPAPAGLVRQEAPAAGRRHEGVSVHLDGGVRGRD